MTTEELSERERQVLEHSSLRRTAEGDRRGTLRVAAPVECKTHAAVVTRSRWRRFMPPHTGRGIRERSGVLCSSYNSHTQGG